MIKNNSVKVAFVVGIVLAASPMLVSAQSFGYGGGGGGGGGGRACAPGTTYNPSTSSCTPTGQVLGASTGPSCAAGDLYDVNTGKACPTVLGEAGFTMELHRGMHNADVMKLQKFLVAKGYSIPDAVTDYFGSQTFAAVQAFQTANGIPATGYVGPLTLAALNK